MSCSLHHHHHFFRPMGLLITVWSKGCLIIACFLKWLHRLLATFCLGLFSSSFFLLGWLVTLLTTGLLIRAFLTGQLLLVELAKCPPDYEHLARVRAVRLPVAVLIKGLFIPVFFLGWLFTISFAGLPIAVFSVGSWTSIFSSGLFITIFFLG